MKANRILPTLSPIDINININININTNIITTHQHPEINAEATTHLYRTHTFLFPLNDSNPSSNTTNWTTTFLLTTPSRNTNPITKITIHLSNPLIIADPPPNYDRDREGDIEHDVAIYLRLFDSLATSCRALEKLEIIFLPETKLSEGSILPNPTQEGPDLELYYSWMDPPVKIPKGLPTQIYDPEPVGEEEVEMTVWLLGGWFVVFRVFWGGMDGGDGDGEDGGNGGNWGGERDGDGGRPPLLTERDRERLRCALRESKSYRQAVGVWFLIVERQRKFFGVELLDSLARVAAGTKLKRLVMTGRVDRKWMRAAADRAGVPVEGRLGRGGEEEVVILEPGWESGSGRK